jgi:hypothetical protein
MLGSAAKSPAGGLQLIDVPLLPVPGRVIIPSAHSMEITMANKEQRGNREKRKPKKEKPKPAPHISTFSGSAMAKTSASRKSDT